MSVRRCQQEISSQEFSEWIAYSRLEPFGELRGDLRAGIIAATLANIHRDRKRRSKPFKAEEFMPDFAGDYEAEEMTPEETLDQVRAMHEMFKSMQEVGVLG